MAKKDAASTNGSSSARYHKLTRTDDGYIDLQFQKPEVKVPWKALLLALCLFAVGTGLIVLGALLLSGYIDTKYSDRTWPVLILGAIMFIPGAYHVRIAYYAFKGYKGYSFDDIPDFD